MRCGCNGRFGIPIEGGFKRKKMKKKNKKQIRKKRKRKIADSRQTKKDNFYKECRSHLEENKTKKKFN